MAGIFQRLFRGSDSAANCISRGMAALQEGDCDAAIADFTEALQVAAQRTDIGPRDLARSVVEMLGAEGSEAGQNHIDFSFAGNKGGKCGAAV